MGISISPLLSTSELKPCGERNALVHISLCLSPFSSQMKTVKSTFVLGLPLLQYLAIFYNVFFLKLNANHKLWFLPSFQEFVIQE